MPLLALQHSFNAQSFNYCFLYVGPLLSPHSLAVYIYKYLNIYVCVYSQWTVLNEFVEFVEFNKKHFIYKESDSFVSFIIKWNKK